MLAQIDEPCLFWLDGHYSAGITARGDKDTSVLDELRCILDHRVSNHVILIDDARKFNGQNDYPTLDFVRELVTSKLSSYAFEVADDIIRIYKDKNDVDAGG